MCVLMKVLMNMHVPALVLLALDGWPHVAAHELHELFRAHVICRRHAVSGHFEAAIRQLFDKERVFLWHLSPLRDRPHDLRPFLLFFHLPAELLGSGLHCLAPVGFTEIGLVDRAAAYIE